jgi:iron complex outermembrane recepter protein
MHLDPHMTLTVGENTSFSSRYYTALVELPGFVQSDFVKIGANVSLTGANNAWGIALIGTNLTNRFTTSYCANGNAQNGLILGGQIAGGPTEGPAGEDEAICYPDPPRQILLQFTIRPLGLLN